MPLSSSPTPSEIVSVLDSYVIGQMDAKKAVAIALRNRSRRKALDSKLKDEIMPKNIIMIGPTGVGKTEIARRLSKLAHAPFIKVEASKYTEVGYVGRDVESIIRDLTTIAVSMVRSELREDVRRKAMGLVEEEILDILVPGLNKKSRVSKKGKVLDDVREKEQRASQTREKFRDRLRAGKLEDKIINLTIEDTKSRKMPTIEVLSNTSMEEIDANIQNMLSNMMHSKVQDKKLAISEARDILLEREYDKLIDLDRVSSEAIKRVEEMGIVFIDEIDKVIKSNSSSTPDISREGVQRDLLPLIEGCSVSTRYGVLNTDHILFIAAGAFHSASPSDLIPELQGRFPIRVELKSLTKEDLFSILTEPANSLIKQYIALLRTEGIKLKFKKDAIIRISELAHKVNSKTENIGARRLHTIMEKLIEDISFNATELKEKNVMITREYVDEKLFSVSEDRDISRYIL